MITLMKWGTPHIISFHIDRYSGNGNLYVGLIANENGYSEAWGDLTVNLGVKREFNRAFIDTNGNGNEIIDWLVAHKLGKPTGVYEQSGHCRYPEFEFDMVELSKHEECNGYY